jgi:hypothetical protein
MATIGDAVSRVRNVLKTVKEDPFMTDRFIYSIIFKYALALMERDRSKVNVFKNSGLFTEIPCFELIEVDKVEACCLAIKTKCTFRRSKYKLPKMASLHGGYLIKTVTSLDYSLNFHETQPYTYVNMTKSTNFKYNTNRYFWIVDDYLFIPDAMIDTDIEAIRISAMFQENVKQYTCDLPDDNVCVPEQERKFNIPEYLFSEIEQLVYQEILTAGQLPSEGADDKQHSMR